MLYLGNLGKLLNAKFRTMKKSDVHITKKLILNDMSSQSQR